MIKVIIQSKVRDHEVVFEQEATIGRHPSSTIWLNDPLVSNHHGVIRKIDSDYFYEDLGSTNGSYVEGVRVTRKKLSDGDRINVGGTTLIIQKPKENVGPTDLVDFSRNEKAGEVCDQIDVSTIERFMPADSIRDLSILHDDYEKLRLGYELLETIGLERDLNSALDKVTKKLLEVFSAGRCVLMLVEQDTGGLKISSVQINKGMNDSTMVSDLILKEVMRKKTAFLLMDVMKDSRSFLTSSLISQGIHSVLCAPILHHGEVLGVVHLDSSKEHGMFTRKDLQLLTGILRYVGVLVAYGRLMKQIEIETKTRAQFERLLSPSVVDQIMSGKVKLEQGGELRNVTILFADIRGFTSLSRRSSATSVVAMLNRYFETVVDVIFKFEGTVDKYIGDEIMVLFGAPVDIDQPADRAVSCALEMQRVLQEFNKEAAKEGKEKIEIGIGINSGEVVVGSIGSSQTMQYTCIGDAVNIASRLTKLAHPGQVLITESTLSKLRSKVATEKIGKVSLKGIEGGINIYQVKGLIDETIHVSMETTRIEGARNI